MAGRRAMAAGTGPAAGGPGRVASRDYATALRRAPRYSLPARPAEPINKSTKVLASVPGLPSS